MDDVNISLTRLLHAGLLEMVDTKTWLDRSGNALAQFDHLPWAVACQVMSRISRMTNSDHDEHVLSSSTIAIDRNRLSVVSKYLEKFRQDMGELLRGGSALCDDVYQLDIFLYPLTTLHKEDKNGMPSNTVSDRRQGPGQGD